MGFTESEWKFHAKREREFELQSIVVTNSADSNSERARKSYREHTRVTESARESPRAHESCRPSESLIRLRSALRLLYNSNTQGKVSFVLFYFVFCLFGIRRSKHLPPYSPPPPPRPSTSTCRLNSYGKTGFSCRCLCLL